MKISRKKGFTLVEIIAVIGILAVIGTASFFGIRLVSKNIRISRLKQITDRALQAAQVYIETNDEARNQLYQKQNGVVIPLNVLVNEGLLSLENTNIKQSDIENEYVATALSSSVPNGDCTEINEVTSWNSDAPIYLCLNKDGSSNSIIIGGTNSNIEAVKVQDEVTEKDGRYIFNEFRSSATENHIEYDGNRYRIIQVDRDDSLILYSKDTFGNTFKDKVQKYSSCETNNCKYNGVPSDYPNKSEYFYTSLGDNLYTDNECKTNKFDSNIVVIEETTESRQRVTGNIYINEETTNFGEVNLSNTEFLEYDNTVIVESNLALFFNFASQCRSYGHYNKAGFLQTPKITIHKSRARKIKLRSCMKITGGTGTEVNPYELKDYC